MFQIILAYNEKRKNDTVLIGNDGSTGKGKVSLFVSFFLNLLVNYWAISWTGPKTERLTILRAATHETELGDHDLSQPVTLY